MFSCAHPISPGGGLKDHNPPLILGEIPENGSANFNTNKFTIEFDEFVELKDIQQQLMISPPLNEKPDFKIKGKSLHVKFNELLQENTTYSVYFGDAIVDITEGNPVSNFTYIFSTGDYVDSLSLQGVVENASNLEPVEECYVMLYKDDNDTISLDSLPYFVRPYYLSKTDEKGRFRLNGLADDNYLLFALKDMNSSLTFDQPAEEIAFLDSLIHPRYVIPPPPDTIAADSIQQEVIEPEAKKRNKQQRLDAGESEETEISRKELDSIADLKFFSKQLETHKLYLFAEKPKTQKLLQSKVIRDNTLEFVFSLPANKLQITPLGYADRDIWYYSVPSKEFDTVTWYFKNRESDTLQVLIKDKADTLEFLNVRLKNINASRRQRKEEDKKLIVLPVPQSKNLAPFEKPALAFFQPIENINLDSSVLITPTDTLINPPYHFTDSLKMKLVFDVETEENSKYTILIPDSTIYDWNGLTNETVNITFKTRELSSYGLLKMTIFNPDNDNVIMQLLGEKDVVVRQTTFKSDTIIEYDYLNPVKYRLKLIFDANNNGKWDTGEFGEKLQAEKVKYFSKTIEVRANWDIEEEWIINR